ncbi:cardiolipin synthase [Furfurilactobacillus entadae]|uniref:cardiolipin synthase n=1 Tax=Furfurilactobacillus entadae TaxID=2922307 RepID=UPI0035EFA2DC
MNWAHIIFEVVIYVNAVLAFITVFREPRDIAATWAWLLVLVFLPVIGFIAYAFVGRRLPKNRLFQIQEQEQLQLDERLALQRAELSSERNEADGVTAQALGTVNLFIESDQAFLTRNNRVHVIKDGKALFHELFEDIERAKQSIHIEFYTIYADDIGHDLLNLLIKKANEGVVVRVLYDSWGSMGVRPKFYDPLRAAGGEAYPFLQTRSAWADFRLNFRDHRKIVVIDGTIGYTGGFNIGDQYLGRKEKFGYWRDTHLRIVGAGIYGLQSRFIRDWNATSKVNPLTVTNDLFRVTKVKGNTNMQIVSSGPDSDKEQIKMGYLRLINSAQKRLWIQSPYLIPDDSVLDALRVAAGSGVDVRIMIPSMPDHAFVYRATEYYAKQLAREGVKIFKYRNGFVHSKTMVVDDGVASVGSANLDFRSFKLNFELNAFIYDPDITAQLATLFEADSQVSELTTYTDFVSQSWWRKFKQTFSRLLSPIL